jgi:hypothetical protein
MAPLVGPGEFEQLISLAIRGPGNDACGVITRTGLADRAGRTLESSAMNFALESSTSRISAPTPQRGGVHGASVEAPRRLLALVSTASGWIALPIFWRGGRFGRAPCWPPLRGLAVWRDRSNIDFIQFRTTGPRSATPLLKGAILPQEQPR